MNNYLSDYRVEKELELIGSLVKERYPNAAFLLEKEWDAKDERGLACAMDDLFPETFKELKAEVQDDLIDWCEQYELTLDPPMDKHDYLRRVV